MRLLQVLTGMFILKLEWLFEFLFPSWRGLSQSFDQFISIATFTVNACVTVELNLIMELLASCFILVMIYSFTVYPSCGVALAPCQRNIFTLKRGLNTLLKDFLDRGINLPTGFDELLSLVNHPHVNNAIPGVVVNGSMYARRSHESSFSFLHVWFIFLILQQYSVNTKIGWNY